MLVEYGKVYKVFKIADKKMYDGKVEKHVFFKPIYETSDNRTLSCAIPLKNLTQANIRRPLDKKSLSRILGFATDLQVLNESQILDINEARDVLKRNNPETSAQMLKSIWCEINDDKETVTKSRKDILELSLKSLSQEVALAFGLSIEKAEVKLQKALEKLSF